IGGEVWLTDPRRAPGMRFLSEVGEHWSVETYPSAGREPVELHVLRPRERG
ncbi:MAG: hypothetical protein QOH74_954, partial [Gaiellales bacterium]|nr:hypothetical protein [Gaiellales bacterium]